MKIDTIKSLSLLFTLMSLLNFSGCATVFSPSSDEVSFTSLPENAEVWLDGTLIGHTPLVHRMDCQTFHTKRITVRSPGHQTQSFPLSKSFNKVAILNLTLWPSWITDALSGSMIEYAPNSYFIELEPRQRGRPEELANSGQRERALRREQTRYLLNNYDSLLRDISRGHGEHLKSYWKISASDQLSYDHYLEQVQEAKDDLLVHSSPLELQKKLSQLKIETKEQQR